jgi:hypothetical protein
MTQNSPLFESFSILVLACKNNEEKPTVVYKWQFMTVDNPGKKNCSNFFFLNPQTLQPSNRCRDSVFQMI